MSKYTLSLKESEQVLYCFDAVTTARRGGILISDGHSGVASDSRFEYILDSIRVFRGLTDNKDVGVFTAWFHSSGDPKDSDRPFFLAVTQALVRLASGQLISTTIPGGGITAWMRYQHYTPKFPRLNPDDERAKITLLIKEKETK